MWPRKGVKYESLVAKYLKSKGFKVEQGDDCEYWRSKKFKIVISIVDGVWESNHEGILHRGTSGTAAIERLDKFVQASKVEVVRVPQGAWNQWC